eukprot:2424380-Prymnesium_polylepis.1
MSSPHAQPQPQLFQDEVDGELRDVRLARGALHLIVCTTHSPSSSLSTSSRSRSTRTTSSAP